MKRFNVDYPDQPKAGWKTADASDADDYWDSPSEDTDPAQVQDSPLLSDADFYQSWSGTTPVSCTSPSLEDGDGLCTCDSGSFTTTITPVGGPGNACPTAIDGVPPSSANVSSPPPTPTPTSLYCTNPSLEDGDGLCTCTQGVVTTTITPAGGPGNSCPTSLP